MNDEHTDGYCARAPGADRAVWRVRPSSSPRRRYLGIGSGRAWPLPWRGVLLALCLATGALAFWCSSSVAALQHVFLAPAIGSAGPGAGQLSLRASNVQNAPGIAASGLAVNQTTGDLYVADTANHRVDQFTSSGEFLRAWGYGVADGISEELQVCTLTCSAGIAGSAPGQLSAPSFIAVDSSDGDVYVADSATNTISKFSATGGFISANSGAGTPENAFATLLGIAVDAAGTLDVLALGPEPTSTIFRFAQDESFLESVANERGTLSGGLAVNPNGDFFKVNGDRSVQEFAPSGEAIGQITLSEATSTSTTTGAAIAVDPANGDLYLNYGAASVKRYAFDAEGGVVQSNGSSCKSFGLQEGCPPSESFSAENLTAAAGIAIHGADHRAYVADATLSLVDPFNEVLVPDATTLPASNLAVTGAELHGEVNPSGLPLTECAFEYGTGTSYGSAVSCIPGAAELGSGTEPVAVHAVLEGLAPNTTYHYRLLVTNANGTNRGADQSFTTPSPPLIESASSASITATSAELLADINPIRSDTTYRFEYGTITSYGTSIPEPEADIGSGETPQHVSQALHNLQPATLYHYRVIATNAFGTTTGADHTFTTQGLGSEASLPDNRQWEQVSPADKFGASIGALSPASVTQAAAAGPGLTYAANAPTEAQPQGNANLSQVLSTRTSSGWRSQDLATPHALTTGAYFDGSEYKFFSSDLSLSVVKPNGVLDPTLSPQASEATAFLRTNLVGASAQQPCTGSCYRPLVSGCPPVGQACAPAVAEHANVPAGTVFGEEVGGRCADPNVSACGPKFVGATPDLSHIVLRSQIGVALTEAPISGRGLYEWSQGALSLIGNAVGDDSVFKSISDDGSRLVFDGVSEGLEGLLLRDTATGHTVQLDAKEAGCSTCTSGEGEFQRASSDGKRIFFSDTQRLTEDSGAAESPSAEPDLYVCEVELLPGGPRCKLTDLTPLSSDEESANVLGGVLGASSDGSSVYFAANGALGSSGVHHGECSALRQVSGMSCNLFAIHYEDGRWQTPKLLAALSGRDRPNWELPDLAQQTARVSPDGQWLAFQSSQSLTGYDNRDAASGERDQEVFLYHASTGALVCASCNPTGARPVGVQASLQSDRPVGIPQGTWQDQWLAGTVPGWVTYNVQQALYQPRYLSDSGRLFFNSPDALVPEAVNHTEDVYQYEPEGVGSCSSSSAGGGTVYFGGHGAPFNQDAPGCVALLSSGTVSGESGFMDASENGEDVYFLTNAHLSPQDTDSNADVYDAHQCSPAAPCFPAAAAAPPACETGDSCKAAPSPQPDIFASPASASFSGAGNAAVTAPGRPKPLTRAQKLARALKVCRAKPRKKRAACVRRARRAYGPHHKARTNSSNRKGR